MKFIEKIFKIMIAVIVAGVAFLVIYYIVTDQNFISTRLYEIIDGVFGKWAPPINNNTD